MKEKEVEEVLWAWLKTKSEHLHEIYFNSINKINGPIFKVKGEKTEIPDLIISCNLYGKAEYIAVEVKDASKGSNVLGGCKIFSKYIKNYIEGRTKYFIDNKEIKINRFVVATQYSPNGGLFESNDFIVKNGSGSKKDNWINKVVPEYEYNRTKDFNRHNIKEYYEYKKKNGIKEAPGLGIIISDVLTTFELEELEKQSGMEGKPLYQGVIWNEKKETYQQCLTAL